MSQKQTDIEDNDLIVDKAITAVRDFQKGKATTSFVRAALAAVPVQQLPWVSTAVRVPLDQLRAMGAK